MPLSEDHGARPEGVRRDRGQVAVGVAVRDKAGQTWTKRDLPWLRNRLAECVRLKEPERASIAADMILSLEGY